MKLRLIIIETVVSSDMFSYNKISLYLCTLSCQLNNSFKVNEIDVIVSYDFIKYIFVTR